MKTIKITTLAAIAALTAPILATAAPPPVSGAPGAVPVTVDTLFVGGGAIKTKGEKAAPETAADRALPALPVTYDDAPAAKPADTKAPTT